MARIFRQPVGEDATGAAAARNDEVRCDVHPVPLTFGVETTPVSTRSTVAATSFADAQKKWKVITENGGTLSQVGLNDPLAIALSLGLSRPQAFALISEFITLVQNAYPDTVVGFNAVYPKMLSGQQISDLEALQAQLKADGSRGLDFYRVDFAWYGMEVNGSKTHPGASFEDLKVVSDHCDSIGLPFSLTCNAEGFYGEAVKKTGKPVSPADDIYWGQGMASLAQSIKSLGWKPRQIDAQDWSDAPSVAIPETDQATYIGSVWTLLQTIYG